MKTFKGVGWLDLERTSEALQNRPLSERQEPSFTAFTKQERYLGFFKNKRILVKFNGNALKSCTKHF